MAIRALPVISEPIYLQDLPGDTGKEIKQLEGKCPRDEQAWVIVRQATESDSLKCSNLVSKRRVEWSDDGRVEEWDDSPLELYAMQVYCCLADAGNIWADTGNAKPLFRFKDGPDYRMLEMGYGAFRKAYGSLLLPVTRALRAAVLKLNLDWDWTRKRDQEGE